MIIAIKAAQKAGDSLGGVVEVVAHGVPVGLGSHVHWDRKLDGRLAQALMSIQAVKGVEVGDGFDVASRPGSEAHDAIVWDDDAGDYRRTSANAGGIEGGMSTGEVLVAHVAMKPLATLNRPVMATVDTATKDATVSFKERTDVTAVPAMGVVAEAMAALVLADEALRKFGGDSLVEFVRNHATFVDQVRQQNIAVAEVAPSSASDPLNWDADQAFGAGADPGPRLRPARTREHRWPRFRARGVGGDDGGGQDLDRTARRPGPRSALLRQRRGHRTPYRAHGGSDLRRRRRAGVSRLESEVLAEALAGTEPSVVAAAGGVVLDPAEPRGALGGGHGGLAPGPRRRPGRPGGHRRPPARRGHRRRGDPQPHGERARGPLHRGGRPGRRQHPTPRPRGRPDRHRRQRPSPCAGEGPP